MKIDQILPTFIAESRERLEEMEASLLQVERDNADPELINAIFRAAHTIKGSAGMFGFDYLVAFAHAAESVLDAVRDGRRELDKSLQMLMLACCDYIGMLVNRIEANQLDIDPPQRRLGDQLIGELEALLPTAPTLTVKADLAAPESGLHPWRIVVRFDRNVLRGGTSPLSIIRYLGELGTLQQVAVLADELPSLNALDPECCYLGFEIVLMTASGRAAIETAFEFVRDECQLEIDRADQPPAQTEVDAQRTADRPQKVADSTAAAPSAEKVPESRSVRVDAARLDQMIDLVGELIVATASAQSCAQRSGNAEMQESIANLQDFVEAVRENALQLRMVRIGATFKRFHRVVHDVSRELGKAIELVVHGEEAELDKTVVEKIGDPLMHLVRNAIDHGIEPVDVRVANGKRGAGTVTLNAYHDSGSIVIEVGDDGGGLKREKILQKAIDRGLVEADRKLSDSEVYDLIFEPGFSTADQITNLSGRGVGMDVVKRNITALRGSVTLRSTEGVGTTVSIRLPLTLAIIDGFLVSTGKSSFVVPLDTVVECLELSPDLAGGDRNPHYLNLRGEVLPLVRLREQLAIEAPMPNRENVVVVQFGRQRAGLVVDRLLGELQTVIKPLGPVFRHLRVLAGSTILGSGEVALILDVPALVRQAESKEREASMAEAGIAHESSVLLDQ